MTVSMQPLDPAAPRPPRPLSSLSVVELVAHAQAAGVDLWVEGERLRFSAPRGALTAELRGELTRRKADLLAFLDRARPAERLPPLAAEPQQGDAPLSFGQERLWFFDQFDPGSAAYNMFQAVRLRGRLVPGALERAVSEVVARHEVLRSRFVGKAGGPVQEVVAEPPRSLPRIDLAALPPAARPGELRRLSVAESRRPFDLGRPPLLRWALLRLDRDEHVVLVTFHHIVSDGWSIGVFVRELLTLYEAFRRGLPSPLPPLPLQYADFAIWQRRHLAGARLERSLDWWRRALEGAPASLDLPVDHPQRRARAREGVELRVPLGGAAEAALRAACGRWGATPFMVLLAAFHALLHRYSGSRDILVGSPVAGRDQVEVEGLIGFFVNTLVMRGRPSAGLSFEDLLGQVRETCLGAYAHQDLPLERLVEELRPERAGAPSPLFEVLFAVQNAPVPPLELPELTCEPLPGVGGQMLFDLTLSVWEGPGGTDLAWGYRRELFEAATVQRLADHFRRLLNGALAQPGRALGELDLLSPAERRQLVVGWNDVASAYPADASLVDLLRDEMRRRPQAVAVSWGERRLAYGDLSRRSGELARRLAAAGVRRGDLVGVALERGIDMVVALVAVLRAGAAYVPLDGDYPDERLAFMLRDTGVPVVLVDAASRPRLAALIAATGLETRALAVDAEDGASAAAAAPPLPAVGPDDLAYVIYTSGSTGTPKGVAVPQRAVVRLVRDSNYLRFTAADRIAQISNVSFDAATFEIWGALLNGGCLVGVDRADVLDPRRLAETLRREAVSAMFLTTTLFNQVIHSDPAAFATVGTVMVGGEALDPHAMRRALQGSPPARLLNGYGPTESTTFAAWHPVREVAADALSVPIGGPLANTTLHVVDAALRLVPVGVAGELVIGGDGLAHGYLRRPGITASRFVPDPFADRPGARLYRSGDLVRRRADGAILFLGRFDDQVKLRGFRVELGEVEAALLALPEVRAAAALVREADGDRRLVAYVVPAGEAAGSDALREALRQRLPEYMVPAAIVVLDELPVTANGKLDRAALAALSAEVDRAPGGGEPIGPLEEVVAALWADVLGVAAVGRDEDFFALGGHSLLATRLVSRIRETLGAELELASFFAAPTVAALAREVAAAAGGGSPPPLEAAPRPPRIPLSFAQQRLWFLDRLVPGSAAYNIPAVLRLRGELRPALLRRALDEVVRRHESLRTTFEADGDRPFQRVHPPRPLRLPIVELAALPAHRREAVARRRVAVEAAQPFDLARGPLLRCLLLRLAADDHVLLVDQHHIVSDGWSAGVLTDELVACYRAFGEGTPPSLAELPVQYADYALWQQQWLQGDTLEAHLEFWRQHLAGAPPLHELPTDRPRPPVQSLRGASLPAALPAPLVRRLEAFARGRGATSFMVLLAAYQAVLGRWAGVRDVVAGAPVAGRDRREIERLIGFFVNLLPLRADLGGGAGFGTLVERVRDGFLAAHRHRELPFERLVEHLVRRRDASYAPLFQVVFALQTAPAGELAAPGLAIEPLSVETGTAKFDLTLSLQPSGDALAGSLEYSTALFDAATVERFVSHFQTFLDGALAAPERPLDEVSLLPDAERRQVLWEWPAGAAPASPPELVPERVLQAAASRPAEPALIGPAGALTYGELAELAARIAAEVRRRGVGPDDRVGVCAARSPAQVAALLGVAWAGAAAVPLDPAHPAERRLAVLRDAGAALLLGDAAVADLGALRCPVVRLDGDLPLRDGHAPPQAAERNLAYVVYTSGSTGLPKGVAVEHRGLANLVAWHLRRFELEARDRVSHLAGLAFDASVWEVWPALCAGAALHLPPEEVRGAPEALRDWLLAERITVAFAPTPLAEALVELRWPERCDLRLLLTGGDRLHRSPPAGLPFPLVNAYGPTENTVVATAGTTRPGEPRVPDIGGPVDGVAALVLDRRLAAVPVGVAGELCLGGAGLARGYLGQPAATAAAFVPHPAAERPGERLYRTGDRARWRADGRLDFLGRLDRQVQIRGFRVEPAEVETALAALPEVREAAVVPVGEGATRRLAAFVVWDGPAGDDATLRRRLSQSLPAYMVPALFVALDALPVDRSGKVLRGGLAARVTDLDAAETSGEAPVTPTEQVLAELWRELLEDATVSRGDDFFARGGHSLLVTRLVARVRDVLAVELPLRTVFEAPTLERMAEAVDRARRGEPSAPPPHLMRQPRRGAVPLSFSQQRLWFLDRLLPGSPAYNIAAAYRVRGPLSPGVLAAVLREIVRRHEVLRTTFASEGADPVQVVGEARVPLPVVDLGGLADARREAEARRLATAEARRPFDLEAGPPARFTLLRREPDDHALLLSLHHAVADGWSAGVLVGELAALYAAFAAGRPSPLAELPVQYADYAIWQRRWLAGPRLEAELEFWRRRLAGAPEVLEVAADRPRPAVPAHRGAVVPVSLTGEPAAAFLRLARRHAVTPFMALLALFAALLSRWSGSRQVVVGTPVAGRSHSALEALVGCFVNTLPLPVRLGAGASFAELAAAVRETVLDVFAHQDVPFERLVEELAVSRDVRHSPLFQVMLTVQDRPIRPPRVAGLEMEPIAGAEPGTAKFDLTLALTVDGEELRGGLEFDRDLFDRSTVESFATSLAVLVERVAAEPAAPLDFLPLLDAAEARQVLVEWNELAGPPRGGGDPVAGLAAQAARRPGAAAVIGERGIVTFGELEERSNRLAHHLRRLGVGPEERVAVRLERSPELLVALLAVLKAGGVYVPLAPDSPVERVRLVLAETRPRVWLADQASPAGAESAAVELRLDRLEAELAALPATPPPAQGLPEQLAYVLYTSGSTGRPKGVMVTRGGLAVYLAFAAQRYAASERDGGVPLHSSIGFDLTVTSLFVPLLTGRPLHVVPEGGDVAGLADCLRRSGGMELVKLTPAHLQVLAHLATEEDDVAAWTGALVIGGEALMDRDLEPWRRLAPRTRLINEYGPTETVVGCSVYEVPPGPVEAGAVPIGRPLPGARLYVLDRCGMPLPPGAVGELAVGGATVSRGYLGRPSQTAERFVPDPFGGSGDRLYRTGDLVRRRGDGELVFVGRRDGQVKLRGVRIELGEVEGVLAEHPAVREVVVALRGEGGEARLLAYVVADPAAGEDLPSALLAAAARRLPGSMVPAAVVVLDRLPLTLHGKVDREALPLPARASRGEARALELPRNRLELDLQHIWEEVLDVRPVGVDEDFFALGGHSLLGIYVVACLRERLGIELPLHRFFQAPTIAGMADAIARPEAGDDVLVPLSSEGSRAPLFVVHGAGGDAFHFVLAARELAAAGAGRPWIGIQAPGLVPGGAVAETVEAMAELYLAALRTARPHGPYLLGGYSMGGLVAWEMGRRLRQAGEAVPLIVLLDARADQSAAARFDERRLIAYFAGELRVPVSEEDLAGDDADALLRQVIDLGRELGRIPREFGLDEARRRLRVMRATLSAAASFRPTQPFDGRTLLLRAEDELADDPALGWAGLAAGGLEVVPVPGDHRSMLTSPHVETLARHLAAALDEAADGAAEAVG